MPSARWETDLSFAGVGTRAYDQEHNVSIRLSPEAFEAVQEWFSYVGDAVVDEDKHSHEEFDRVKRLLTSPLGGESVAVLSSDQQQSLVAFMENTTPGDGYQMKVQIVDGKLVIDGQALRPDGSWIGVRSR